MVDGVGIQLSEVRMLCWAALQEVTVGASHTVQAELQTHTDTRVPQPTHSTPPHAFLTYPSIGVNREQASFGKSNAIFRIIKIKDNISSSFFSFFVPIPWLSDCKLFPLIF